MAQIKKADIKASDLILSQVQKELTTTAIIAPTVMNLSSRARKGIDRITIPDAGSLSAVDKVADTASAWQGLTYSGDVLLLDKHKHVPVKIEDIASIEADHELETDVIMRMSSAMVRQIETDLLTQIKLTSAAAPDHRQQYANTPTDTIQATDIRLARRLLNDQNVPQDNRYMLINPTQEQAMLGISDFIEAQKFGEAVQATGIIGRVYGFWVKMTTTITTASETVFYHGSHVAWALQQAMKYETKRASLDQLADEFSLSAKYGSKVLKSGVQGVLFNSTGA